MVKPLNDLSQKEVAVSSLRRCKRRGLRRSYYQCRWVDDRQGALLSIPNFFYTTTPQEKDQLVYPDIT